MLLAAACATPETDRLLAGPGASAPVSARVELDGVPFHPQEQFQCGPASLAMVLGWSGVEVDPDRLREQAFTEARKGSLQPDMVTAARRNGRVAYEIASLDEILREIEAGHPVLVFQNLGLGWIPRFHYAVSIGYDLDAATLLLHTGRSERRAISLRLFERTWARAGHWAIVVLPPDVLPATARERPYLMAVTGLERAGRPSDAAIAYTTALERWPGSLGGWIGLGNARYDAGDREGAAVAFAEAARLHPDSVAAQHNLAETLAALGRAEEAAVAAKRAAELSAPVPAAPGP